MENVDLISREGLLERIERERAYLKARGLYGAEEVLTKYLHNIVEDMPPARFAYNINYKIKVKLTEYGKDILRRDVIDSMSILENLRFDSYSCYPEDEDGYITFQLWDFMRIFGSHFYLGSPLIIEHNEIIFGDKVD